ncbi:hypothetical protein O181_095491 [Austropuccinia psidii MF-1]|uniref:Uncharacterized protein n=1 Tax=Austropuccinia psidii MF-1 TaxID=1389203 RepID=A0A9Q3J578_9BASI|nr:hypothetical protein [Austropuccinia psidii MF-1]
MHPLGILDTNIVFPHPAASVRMEREIIVINNGKSQNIILGNDYLNIYGIDINNHKDRYFTIGENGREKVSFSNMTKKISIVSSNKDTYKEYFLLISFLRRKLIHHCLQEEINVLYTFKNVFASDNEPLGAIKGHEVDITLNIDRSYPPVLRGPAYPAIYGAREALEKHIKELIQMGVLGKVGHNEEVEVTTPVIIASHNEKSRIVGDF